MVSRWNTNSKIKGDGSEDFTDLQEVSEQFFILRENFHRIPSMTREEDYCGYRLMETHRRLQSGLLSKALSWINKKLFGFMLIPFRVFRTVLLVITLFTLCYAFWPYGNIVPSDRVTDSSRSLFDCLYFSIITFTTVGYGDIHPSGSMKVFAMAEAILGIFLMAMFTLSIGRKLLRW